MPVHRTMLAELMDRMNLTKEDFESRFEKAGRDIDESISVSPRQLSRWMAGDSGAPRPAARRVLEHMFQRPASELLAALPAALGDDPVSDVRTKWSAQRAYMSSEALLNVAATRARSFGLDLGRAKMADEVVEQLREDLYKLGGLYQTVPLTTILPNLVNVQDGLFRLLETRQSPSHARDLYFLSGIACGMLAKASHDLADPHAALTQARTAFLCAEQADHHGLMSWVRSSQSLIAYWAGRPRDALEYAKSAQVIAAQSTAGVWAAMSEARALGSVGSTEEALTAVSRAEMLREQVVADELDGIGGLFAFGAIRQMYYAGEALSWTPAKASLAADYATRAVEGYKNTAGPEWAFGDQAGAQTTLAIARIQQSGDPSAAKEALDSVLSLPVEKRANGIVLSVRRVERVLVASRLDGKAHGDIRQEIENFCRVPLAALSS